VYTPDENLSIVFGLLLHATLRGFQLEHLLNDYVPGPISPELLTHRTRYAIGIHTNPRPLMEHYYAALLGGVEHLKTHAASQVLTHLEISKEATVGTPCDHIHLLFYMKKTPTPLP
jgi:hypothetical protein